MKHNSLSALALAAFAAPVFGANPIFTDRWTADPAPFVDGDTIYVYAGHDAAKDGEMFNMPDWVCYSSKDLKTWQSHGALLKSTDFPCGGEKSAWASQVVKKGGKYYWYVTYTHKKGGGQSVGVAVAESPIGPWKPHSEPVVTDKTTPSPYWGNDIDPTVFVDDDGTAWMSWGNPVCYLAKLSDDMLSIDGEIRVIPLPNYTEAPWLDKRGKTYYLIYASRAHQGFGEHMDYATAPSIEGPWTYRGRLTGGAKHSYTIHPGLCRFKGRDILFYHNATLVLDGVGGATGRRCVTADWVEISPNGPIKPFVQTQEGLDLPQPEKGEYKDGFAQVRKPGTAAKGYRFAQSAIVTRPRKSIDGFVRWGKSAVYKSVENPFMDSPQCDGFNMHGLHKDSMSEKFTLDADLTLSRIDFYLTDGEGTDGENPLSIVLREKDRELFAVNVDYVPQGYGVAGLAIDKAIRPKLKKGVEYTLELRGKKGSAVAYWRRGWDGKKPHAFALYGDMAEPLIEVRAYEVEGDRGGLGLEIRKEGGEWAPYPRKNHAFTHSNLGNWGEKKLFDPVLYHDKDGSWHIYYKDSKNGKDGHAVSWDKDNLNDWGRQNWVDNEKDRERMAAARAGDGVCRLTRRQFESLGKSAWHKTAPWHLTIDSAKDDVQRYGEAAKTAKLTLKVKTGAKPYKISDMLVGLFFEDINNAWEVYKDGAWRSDIVKALKDLKPKFLRFPGGCIVHGRDFKSMYRWKDTVGPVESRPKKPNLLWGGELSREIGYYEYFTLCEMIGAEPVPVLPAGVSCPNPQKTVTDDELKELVADAVDLVDFAKGDPRKSKWAKIRADMGHPKPFSLKYIGIGNEEDVNDYFERGFKPIFEAVKKKDPSITVIGTAGPSFCGRDYEEGWRLGKKLKVPILDEHYYVGCGWYYGNQHFYDDYDRKGPKVYLGEYAAHKEGRVNDMETALACAVHLCNLERNGDIVEMASYAPLFARHGKVRWQTDMIFFDDEKVDLTMDYWAQWLWGNYAGREYIPCELSLDQSVLHGGDAERYRNRFAASIVRDGKRTILKIVNSTCLPIPFECDLAPLGAKGGMNAEIVEFAGKSFDDNDARPFAKREKIAAHLARTLPANSITVIAF